MVQTGAQERAVAEYPELQRLVEMRVRGWMFRVVVQQGQLVAVKGLHVWHAIGVTWADMVQIRNRTDAAAVRLNPRKELVWTYEGDMTGAIDALIELPHPDAPNAPRLVVGSVSKIWIP